jgi:hypothetical protein
MVANASVERSHRREALKALGDRARHDRRENHDGDERHARVVAEQGD